MTIEQVRHMSNATESETEGEGVFAIGHLKFFVFNGLILIRTHTKTMPRYDWVWSVPARGETPAKTVFEVAREKYAAERERVKNMTPRELNLELVS